MTEIYWGAILLGLLALLRIAQWFVVRGWPSHNQDQSFDAPMTQDVNSLGTQDDSEGTALGATGIVPGGVSWTQPEKHRAAIELGKKRFGKGRNG